MENLQQEPTNIIKAVILIGGPGKGTRFRPLSLEQPKPLFPVAGFPVIYHHIEACYKISGMKEILLIGFYEKTEPLTQFIRNTQLEFKIQIRYLQEFTSLGTAGGLYHFRDQILSGCPDQFFVMNADVCCDFPLQEMLDFQAASAGGDHFTILATEATRQQAMQYGCIVEDKETHEVLHYVEKPETYVSTSINCGVYLFTPSIFKFIRVAFLKHQEETYNQGGNGFDFNAHCKETIHLEKEVFQPLAGSGKLFVFHTTRFWSQIKSAGAAIYANRHYLEIYRRNHPERLTSGRPMPGSRSRLSSNCESQSSEGAEENQPIIIGDVFVHHTASVDPTAVLGPNVSIGRHVIVGAGVRVRESIVLQDAVLRDHCCVLNSVIGWSSIVGEWSRVEGASNDPNPNRAFAKLEILPVFNSKGQLSPSVTVIGSHVEVPSEIAVLNSIVLPHKHLTHSFKNQIVL